YPVYRVHWLRTKALRDRWEEEVQLLTCETEWSWRFFSTQVDFWSGQSAEAAATGSAGMACYSARQCHMYQQLQSLC
ncbi:hypothetical protein SCLCIDRAFT_128326, partial [Scleroderma citrinum Foug A]